MSGDGKPVVDVAAAAQKRRGKRDPDIPGIDGQDPLEFLLAVQNNPLMPVKERIAAAKLILAHRAGGSAAVPKKVERQAAADAVEGRFAPAQAPRLAAVNGGKQ